jgi:hypothetical protein
LFVKGLIACHRGNSEIAGQAIGEAERIQPELRDYRFLWPLLRRQGRAMPAALWQSQLQQYMLFRQIDAFLISYPKCGRTWVRMMLGYFLTGGEDGDPLEIFDLTKSRLGCPVIDISHDDYPHWKTKEDISQEKTIFSGKKVVFLVRDPRDVLVSYYFQYTKRGDKNLAGDSKFYGTMIDFVWHPVGGLVNIVEFFNVWSRNSSCPREMIMQTYEDYHRDPDANFNDLIDFLDLVPHGRASVRDAVDFARFNNLRKLEESNVLGNVRLSPPPDGDPDGYKVRRGVVGGYRDYFTVTEIEAIDDYLRQNLDSVFHSYLR